MLARDLFELRTTLARRGIIFAYSGYVTEPVLSGVEGEVFSVLVPELE